MVAILVYDNNFMIVCDQFQKLTDSDCKIGHGNSRSYDKVVTNL